MRRPNVLAILVCSTALFGDTVVLRNGKLVEGTYLGGDSRQVRLAVGESIRNINVTEISEIRFGATAAPLKPAAPSAPAAPRERIELMRPERETATAAPRSSVPVERTVEIPAGSSLIIRMIDDVDSERDRVGQTFRASLDEPVLVDGATVAPRGADVVVKLIDDKQSGKLTGRTELTLDIQSLTVNGKSVDVTTQDVTQASSSRTTQTAQRAGGGAAIGAIIGAIAGGGRGAAIGAATGAAAGGAVQIITKGQRVRIPSETRLTFTLQQPVRI